MAANRFHFRAWDTVMRDWALAGMNEVTGHFFVTGEKDGRFTLDSFDSEGGRFVVMQSTGLTDKNGVEIFEGDILRFLHQGSKVCPDAAVEYKVMSARFVCRGMAHNDRLDRNETGYYTIIGNIHENPELLEAK